jgi:mono/diheme cytochrome c family protein
VIVPRWLRWTGYGVLAVFGLIVAAVAALYLVTSLRFRRTYAIPDSPVRATADSAGLARGRHLVEAIGKCQECHGADYGGKVIADSPAFARLAATNLTSGRGGIAGYTDADFEAGIFRYFRWRGCATMGGRRCPRRASRCSTVSTSPPPAAAA